MVVSTSWVSVLDTFIRQSSDRKLFDRATFVLPLAESSLERVGKALPPGHIISARGDHYFLHPRPDDPEALKRFVENYRKRYTSYPIYPCYHMAQAISATQAAYAKAVQAKQGGWPNDAELSAAFRNLEFASPTTKVRIREDHQGVENILVGKTRQDEKYPFATLTDMMLIPGDLVSTPVGQKSADWLKALKPDMVQQLPQTIAG